jgi:hypothetical protein
MALPFSESGTKLRLFLDNLIIPQFIITIAWRCSSVGQSTRLISAASVVRLHSPPPLFSLTLRAFTNLTISSRMMSL